MADTGSPKVQHHPSLPVAPHPAPHEYLSSTQRLDHEGPHGLGETEEDHALHAHVEVKNLWGLSDDAEAWLFYFFQSTSLCLEICAAAIGAYYHTWNPPFIGTMTCFMVLHWAAWFQTVTQMLQRASWVREESDLETRRRFLHLAVRLNRLMLPTAVVGLVTFIQAYVRRATLGDVAYWLLFLLVFIFDTVFSVMNAYNNITWESDRLLYEEGDQPYRISRLAILGLPSPPKKENGKEREGKEV